LPNLGDEPFPGFRGERLGAVEQMDKMDISRFNSNCRPRATQATGILPENKT
jgi:hypothetical protein